jgi:hypothetical protein
MGSLAKRVLAPAWGVAPGRLFHVSIMPCYDKKLEASRSELTLQLPEAAGSSTSGSHGAGGGDMEVDVAASGEPGGSGRGVVGVPEVRHAHGKHRTCAAVR